MSACYNGARVPDRMLPALNRWFVHGVLPDDFLQAVLRNDLRAAVERADDENRIALSAFVAYLYNEAPSPCWGSPDKVTAWVARHAAQNEPGAPRRYSNAEHDEIVLQTMQETM